MSTCETILRARTLAERLGLDPNKVVCPAEGRCDQLEGGCEEAVNDFFRNPNWRTMRTRSLPAAPVDPTQKFYSQLEKHEKIINGGVSSGT